MVSLIIVGPHGCLTHSFQLDTVLCVSEAHFWMLKMVSFGFTLVEIQGNKWGLYQPEHEALRMISSLTDKVLQDSEVE